MVASYQSFQSDIECINLHNAHALDHYLCTSSLKWTPSKSSSAVPVKTLQRFFKADAAACGWPYEKSEPWDFDEPEASEAGLSPRASEIPVQLTIRSRKRRHKDNQAPTQLDAFLDQDQQRYEGILDGEGCASQLPDEEPSWTERAASETLAAGPSTSGVAVAENTEVYCAADEKRVQQELFASSVAAKDVPASGQHTPLRWLPSGVTLCLLAIAAHAYFKGRVEWPLETGCTTELCKLLQAFIMPAALSLLLFQNTFTSTLKRLVPGFSSRPLEEEYSLWSTSAKRMWDMCFQTVWLLVASCVWVRLWHTLQLEIPLLPYGFLVLFGLMAPAIPAALVSLLRPQWYLHERDMLLATGRMCFTATMCCLQQALPNHFPSPVFLPVMTTSQALISVCAPIQLSLFLPLQLLHLLAVLFSIGLSCSAVQILEVLCCGLCLPGLFLYGLELRSRQIFLATRKHK